MNAAYQFHVWSLKFAARLSLCLAVCLLLAACGNKGDLYLQELELNDEQKNLLDELGANDVQSQVSPDSAGSSPRLSGESNELDVLDELDKNTLKKKKAVPTTTQ